jgi:hypothetical protein
MPLFFFIVGFILVDSGFRGNAQALYQQFATDAKGFVAFAAVIFILGAMGFSSALRPVAKGLLLLVFVVFFIRKGNNITQGIEQAVNSTAQSVASDNSAAQAGAVMNNIASSVQGDVQQVANDANSVNGILGTIGKVAGTAAEIAAIF